MHKELSLLVYGLGAQNLTEWDNQISTFEKQFELLIMDLVFYESPQLQDMSVVIFSKSASRVFSNVLEWRA